MFNNKYYFRPKTNFEQKYKKLKRKFITLLVVFFIFLIGTSMFIYSNYSYLGFKHLIANNYIYTDTLDKMYKDNLNIDVNGEYYNNFDNLIIELFTQELQSMNNDYYTYLYTPEAMNNKKMIEKQEADKSYYESISEDVVYLKITNFSKYTEKFIKSNKKEIGQYSKLILDLRDNSGGDVFSFYDIADLFLPKGDIISRDITRSKLFTRDIDSSHKPYFSFEHIVILQNKGTASASENMIMALKENLSNVTLIGSKTTGKGVGQFTLPLKDGYGLKATTMYWLSPNGNSINNVGIAPDIVYTYEENLIDYSVEYLKNSNF